MARKITPAISVFFYIAAGITALAATYMAFRFIPYIVEDVRDGMPVVHNLAYIIRTCLDKFFRYHIYALLLWGAGKAMSYAATAAMRSER